MYKPNVLVAILMLATSLFSRQTAAQSSDTSEIRQVVTHCVYLDHKIKQWFVDYGRPCWRGEGISVEALLSVPAGGQSAKLVWFVESNGRLLSHRTKHVFLNGGLQHVRYRFSRIRRRAERSLVGGLVVETDEQTSLQVGHVIDWTF